MGSHQRFQRITLRWLNNHRIGGQQGHRNLPSQLPICHATAPPIRLLFCCRKAASLRLPSYLHARRSRNFRLAVLAVLGLCLGITQFKARARFSPYRGWFYWHHLAGLIFGITTLTFVISGLFSLNPWGFLEDRPGGGEQARLEGGPLKWGEVRASLNAIS